MSIKRAGEPLPQPDLQIAKRVRHEKTTIYDLPQDCLTHALFLSARAPIYARVCKSWQNAALNSYRFTLDTYARKIPHFVPEDCSSALETVKRAYLAVMKNRAHIPKVQAAMTGLDRSMPLAMPLVLGPAVKLVEDENLVKFFKKLERRIPHSEEPLLEGDLAKQSAAIRNWMKKDQASLDRVKELDFFNYGLTTLPPEIGRFRNLQSLSLRHGNSITLPLEMGKLTALADLNLSNNQLANLPEEITQLTSLRNLNLSSNRLTALSPEITKLTNLQRLWLHDNPLTTLPQEIIELPKLESLELTHIHLKNLPERPLTLVANLCTLDKIIGAFEACDNHKALQVFETLPSNIKNGVYAKLNELTPFLNEKNAELSFLHINGWWTSNASRIQALRTFIITNF